MDDSHFDEDMLARIITRINGFAYRCLNDRDYTMIVLEGSVQALTGHAPQDFFGPGAVTLVGLTHQGDRQMVFDTVDAALAARRNWQIDYRLVRADGSVQWIQETGGGVFGADGELLYLEGILLDMTERTIERAEKLAMQAQINEKCVDLLEDAEPILQILRQLRILAVNARIEAARTGEVGAGFAVIAAEMGRIADDSSARAGRVAALTRELQDFLTAS